MSGVQRRHLSVPNSGSERTEIITLSPHGRVPVIITILPAIFALIKGVAPDTLLTCNSIGCRTPRLVSMTSRVTFLLISAIVAETQATLAVFNSPDHLLLGRNRVIIL